MQQARTCGQLLGRHTSYTKYSQMFIHNNLCICMHMYVYDIYRHTYVTCRLPLDVSTQFTSDELPGLDPPPCIRHRDAGANSLGESACRLRSACMSVRVFRLTFSTDKSCHSLATTTPEGGQASRHVPCMPEARMHECRCRGRPGVQTGPVHAPLQAT